jgi:hypothetical protein
MDAPPQVLGRTPRHCRDGVCQLQVAERYIERVLFRNATP